MLYLYVDPMLFCIVQGSVKEMLNLSQQDYVKRIEELNQALVSAWDADQRVKALKIVIQVSTSLLNHFLFSPFQPPHLSLHSDIFSYLLK